MSSLFIKTGKIKNDLNQSFQSEKSIEISIIIISFFIEILFCLSGLPLVPI